MNSNQHPSSQTHSDKQQPTLLVFGDSRFVALLKRWQYRFFIRLKKLWWAVILLTFIISGVYLLPYRTFLARPLSFVSKFFPLEIENVAIDQSLGLTADLPIMMTHGENHKMTIYFTGEGKQFDPNLEWVEVEVEAMPRARIEPMTKRFERVGDRWRNEFQTIDLKIPTLSKQLREVRLLFEVRTIWMRKRKRKFRASLSLSLPIGFSW